MEIAILNPGMPVGPTTLEHYSLGGSETAALMMAKELTARGHLVTLFCNLPPADRADHIVSGGIGDDGVRYITLDTAPSFLTATDIDLLICSRAVDLMMIPHQARKAVLWCHDLATHKDFAPKFNSVAWVWDEVWCVSEYHRQQIHKVTGYPLDKIRATRNGISRQSVEGVLGTIDRQLLYAARPERGLANLVRPGGIMERLPDFNLLVCTYDNSPPHMADYYQALFARCAELPNVKLLPPQTQKQLRTLMAESWAYVYPTAFEEVSCIIAREAIEQHLPFITTDVGALGETLGASGIYHYCPRDEIGGDAFCEAFAGRIKTLWDTRLNTDCLIELAKSSAASRTDLYWDGVAEQWEGWASIDPSPYSLVRSMIEDADVIPAVAYLNSLPVTKKTAGVRWLEKQIQDCYPYLYGRESFHDYYARYYELEDAKGARGKPHMEGNQRYEAIATEISKLPAGSRVLDYGCAEGVICNALAKRFPDKSFVAVDFNDGNINLAAKYAKEDGLTNIDFLYIKETSEIKSLQGGFGGFICSEVMEHVTEPWSLLDQLEEECNPGAKAIITVPAGPWEATGLYDPVQFHWRAHIWHVNKWMLRKMLKEKESVALNSQLQTIWADGRNIGHTVVSYTTNGKPSIAVDALEKAIQHRPRQTCAGAIIARNSQGEIKRCLDSISREVHQVQIALGPSTDHTVREIEEWSVANPWVEVRIKHVPQIEAGKFGFDDARNASMEGLEADWVLWIDTDEYLSNTFRKYLRANAFDSYAIHQHHFTVEPRGAPAQLDKPARLFRNNGTFTFYGKVHEHAEKGFNAGPGYAMVLPDVDIGHTGYVNEPIRKQRFQRNLPFLRWDREVYPDRKLGMFLWLRDLVHIMRDYAVNRDTYTARQFAHEAIAFYESNAERFEFIGAGVQSALDYVGEARAFLGIGIFMSVKVTMPEEKKEYEYHGMFVSEQDAMRVGQKLLKDEYDRRNSGYWQ